jgi:hypothetical protein
MIRLSLIALLASVFFLSGCSYGCEFVVINASSGPITVEYHAKGPGKSTVANPAKVSTDEFKTADYHWREIPKDQYQFDEGTATFIISLAPNEVLLVERSINCGGREEERFDISFVKIEGAQGTILASGHQALREFKQEDSHKYIIRYR